MFISKINFNDQQKNYLSFKGLNSNILKNVVDSRVVKEKGADIAKTALVSLTAFAALYGITSYKVKDAVKNGELDMQGKKVDVEGVNTKEYLQRQETYKQILVTKTSFIQENGISSEEFEQAVANGELDVVGKKVNTEGEKTKEYLQRQEIYKQILVTKTSFIQENGISSEEFEQAVANGELDMVGKKVNPEGEKTKAYIQNLQLQRQLYRQTHMPKTAFGQLIGISIHSVEWHINKGNINQKEDGTIDLTDPKNKFFLENFKKLERKQVYKYTPENYDKLQRKLGAIKLDFCLERGYLVADEDGSINMENPINKEFLEKVEKKEISISDFYMSKQDFARMVHQGDITLKKAINNDELYVDSRNGIDISHPKNKAYMEKALANQIAPGKRREVRPEGYVSRKAVANMLGISVASLSRHVQKGYLIEDENGIDLNNPINKYFIDNYEKGAPKDMPEGYEAVEVELTSNRIKKANHVGKYKFAERLGMSAATLEHHIQAGHVVYTKDGIDLTHPQNVHFMNNYRRGEEYLMPGQEKVVKDSTPKERNLSVQTSFNHLLVGELSKMIKLCKTVIGFHFGRGRLEKTEDKKIDLSNPLNREFIAKYEDAVIEAYKNMSDEELEECVKDLKSLLKRRMSENIYMVSANLLSESDELYGYLKYSLENIVNTSDLTSEQKELLTEMMEEIVLEELTSDRVGNAMMYESSEKLDIFVYKNLLSEILKRQNAPEAVDIVEASDVAEIAEITESAKAPEIVEEIEVAEENEVIDDDSIENTNRFNEILKDVEKDYARELETFRTVMSQKIEELTDAYMQYKFASASKDYFKLRNFNDQMMKKGLPIETEDKNIQIMVEKVLSQVGSPKFELSYSYKNWKKEYMPKNAEAVVSDMIAKYGESLMAKVCTEEALKELQKTNPTMEMQDLEDIVCEKFDL